MGQSRETITYKMMIKMKNKIIRIVGCMASSLLLTLSAYGQTEYSLEQCRRMAMENNIKMRTATTNIEMAEQQKKEAFTKYFPTVSAVGVGYDADKGLIETNLATMNISLLKNGVIGGVSAVQPIFTGGQIVNGNRLAEVGVDVNRLQQRQSQNDVRQMVEQYYWQLIILKEKLRTLGTVQDMLARMEKDVNVAVKAGVTRRNDLLQVQLRQNDMTTTRINLENSLNICRRLMAQYIGAKEENFDVANPMTGKELPSVPIAQPSNHEEALPNTVEYQLLDKNVEASKLQKRLEIGKNLPTVGVGVSYSYNNLTDKSNRTGMVFATVSVPLSGWWGGSHAIKRRSLQLHNAEMERDNDRELLLIKMQKSLNDWEDACKKTAVAQRSIEQATENLRLNENYYKAGTSKMSDLLDAQSLYQQSRDKYVEDYAMCKIKQVEYEVATGK
jgi:outer membrane protein